LLQGKVLGLIKYSTTSVGMIPLGKGKIVIFGGFIPSASYAKIIAKDISQIIVSGVLSGKIEFYKKYSISNHETVNDKIKVTIPAKYKFILYVFQNSQEGLFYKRLYINSGGISSGL